MKPKLSDLWKWTGPLSAGTYFFWGILLTALKYNIDRVLAHAWHGERWSIFNWPALRLYLWQSPFTEIDRPFYLTLLIAALPFLWIGTVLTLRRIRTLGWNPLWVLLFFVPVVKLFFFVILSLLRSKMDNVQPPPTLHPGLIARIFPRGAFINALLAIVITTAFTILLAWLGMAIFQDYGWSIFIGLPFAMGFLSALFYSIREERTAGQCVCIANVTVILVGCMLILFALEGAICLIMVSPIAFAVATMGGLLGFAVQKTIWWRKDSSRLFCSVLLLAPLVMGIEHNVPPPLPLLSVTSSVIIDAPPEKVWQNVVSFSELPPPREMIFKLGVAYPIRAEIKGCGVGAIRHCNFSTGPFVEPIEIWDEPNLLKFSVTENPEPLQEWTPYHEIHPAHLDGYLVSRGGQFRLIRLDGGRTLLEGTTWYYHHLWPAKYWQFWSDHIIHTIHLRVLNHVKELSEKPTHE